MYGFADAAAQLDALGFAVEECALAANVLETCDPVARHYGFALSGA